MKTALLSVYNKEGIVEFAKELINLDFKIYASGGTAKALSSANLQVSDVADLVGGKAILGHRVVTLSREIYAGLLSRDVKEDEEELKRLGIPRIDLVCVDLYPLSEEIKSENSTQDTVIEKTDIGGPTLLRAAAKGRRVVVCDPADRQSVVNWLKEGEPEKEKFISKLAAKAEAVVADYALASARYHSKDAYDGLVGKEVLECKYGENAWQQPAGLFALSDEDELSLAKFKVVSGTAPSYNNLADVDRLLQTVTHIAAAYHQNFGEVPSIAVGVKHGNACGASVDDDPVLSIKKMLEGDLRAIFGGVTMVNFKVDEKLAEVILTHKVASGRRLLDTVIAPEFSAGAIEVLKRKGDKCRFLVNPALASLSKLSLDKQNRFRYVRGGFLKQPNYNFVLSLELPGLDGADELSEQQKKDIMVAWAVGSTSNSNTVTLVKNQMLIGNGVGQQDRVGGCELAIKRATDASHDIINAVAYSDSFFPFTDGPEKLAESGITTIFTSSGSVRDEEIKNFCKSKKITLVMIPDKTGRGFFGH